MDPLHDLIRTDYSVLVNVLRDLMGRVNSQNDRIAVLESSLSEKETQIKTLAQLVKGNNQRIDDLSSRVDVLAKRSDEVDSELNAFANDITDAKASAVQAHSRLDALGSRVGHSSVPMSPTSAGMTSTAAMIAAQKAAAEMNEKLNALEARVTATEGFVVPIKQLERTKVSAEDHVAQVRDLEAQITRLQEALTRAQAQVRDHEDSLAQVRALASKLAQQEKLTAEKAYVDQEALSRYVERATYDKEVTDLQDRDSQMASAIGELSGELRRLKDTVDSLVTLEKMRREVEVDNRKAIGQLGTIVNSLTDRVNDAVLKKDLLSLREDLVKQVRDAAMALKDHVKKELRRFEKDVMDYVSEGSQQQQADATETALGKVYFRCLTCNQTTASQHGPHSRHYQTSMGISQPSLAVKPSLSLIASGGMLVERGEDLTLHGADGQVYKGREDPVVHFASPDTGLASSPIPLLTGGAAAVASAGYLSARGSGGAGGAGGAVSGAGAGPTASFRVLYTDKERPSTRGSTRASGSSSSSGVSGFSGINPALMSSSSGPSDGGNASPAGVLMPPSSSSSTSSSSSSSSPITVSGQLPAGTTLSSLSSESTRNSMAGQDRGGILSSVTPGPGAVTSGSASPDGAANAKSLTSKGGALPLPTLARRASQKQRPATSTGR